VKKNILLGFIVLIVFSCKKVPETFIPYLEGYWEIVEVSIYNKPIKTYKISASIDYFKVNSDFTGFRKKVKPSLEGTYTVTQHESSFNLVVKNNQLNIIYDVNNVIFNEVIEKATKRELIISNSEGFKYTYKPFEPFNFKE
jgi:hypothetical protein